MAEGKSDFKAKWRKTLEDNTPPEEDKMAGLEGCKRSYIRRGGTAGRES